MVGEHEVAAKAISTARRLRKLSAHDPDRKHDHLYLAAMSAAAALIELCAPGTIVDVTRPPPDLPPDNRWVAELQGAMLPIYDLRNRDEDLRRRYYYHAILAPLWVLLAEAFPGVDPLHLGPGEDHGE